MNLEVLRALERTLAEEIPSFRVCFKDESKFMRALGLLMSPFNATFMTEFTTTIGYRVYFPSRAWYEGNPPASVETLSHEFVHMHDNREAGIRFQLSYGAPQLWAVPLLAVFTAFGGFWPLMLLLVGYGAVAATCGSRRSLALPLLVATGLGVVGLAVVTAGWWTLILLAALGCLAPWTSAARTHWEARGYAMNVAIYMWMWNALVPEDVLQSYVRYFTGPDYYYMCRDRAKVESLFATTIRATLERRLEREPPYSMVHTFLVKHGLVAPAFSE